MNTDKEFSNFTHIVDRNLLFTLKELENMSKGRRERRRRSIISFGRATTLHGPGPRDVAKANISNGHDEAFSANLT